MALLYLGRKVADNFVCRYTQHSQLIFLIFVDNLIFIAQQLYLRAAYNNQSFSRAIDRLFASLRTHRQPDRSVGLYYVLKA